MRFMAERGDRSTSMRQRVWTGESTTNTATSISATTSATGATKWTPRRLGAVETGGTPPRFIDLRLRSEPISAGHRIFTMILSNEGLASHDFEPSNSFATATTSSASNPKCF